jgi:hypothetical protein
MKYTGTIKDEQGKSHTLNLDLLPITTTEPAPQPEPQPQPEETATSSIPLSYNDARFKNNTTAPSTTIASGGTLLNKTITDTGHTASIVTRSGATIKNCRVNSREGVRIGGGGDFLIDGCYLEATGQGDDHADTIQTYSPGSKGSLKIRNTAIVAHNQAATAGLFVADRWSGEVDLENVVFIGGPYGCRIHPDGGDIRVRFKNVFFVGPFGYDDCWVDTRTLNGTRNIVELWENVRSATIVDGKLVPGTVIPRP